MWTRIAMTVALGGLLLASGGDVLAHGGGLDTFGCHHDRKAGGYHCHRGSLAGQSFETKEEVIRALGAGESAQPQQPGACCKVCKKGKPCGNSCIAANKTCRQPPGCAC